LLARTLSVLVEPAYTLMRVVAGLMFSMHGMQKLFGLLSEGPGPEVGSQLWFGGVIELVCGLALAVGLLTRWAAFLASGTMAVAYVQFHWKLAGGAAFFPVVNKGELALLYCVVFFFIACRGAGRWSFDRTDSGAGGGQPPRPR
jgi:putative oxidoreductase